MSRRLEKIKIENLQLDLFNPRLPKSKQGKDEQIVIEYLLLEAATVELMVAIGENDFFEGELLLVVEEPSNSGKYTVIEGNRRLTATKLLSNPELTNVKKISTKEVADTAKFKPTEIPCLIFDNKNEILKYLGFRHITGIKSWRLLEKARYLKELKEREFNSIPFLKATNEIAKMIGSSSAYVKRLIIAFDLYLIIEKNDFYHIDGLNDTKFFLNYLTDSLIKDNIRTFIGVDLNNEEPLQNVNNGNLEKITTWWFEKTEGKSRVLGDSEGLKLLDKVVGHKEALEAFDSKPISIEEAYEITGDLDIQFERRIKDSLKAIERADVLSNKVKAFYSDLYEDLKTIRKIANKINEFKTKIESDGDDF